jgi:hypothetical protein
MEKFDVLWANRDTAKYPHHMRRFFQWFYERGYERGERVARARSQQHGNGATSANNGTTATPKPCADCEYCQYMDRNCCCLPSGNHCIHQAEDFFKRRTAS